MKRSKRYAYLVFFAALLISQFQNCSNSAQNTMFTATSTSTSDTSDPGKATLQVSSLVSLMAESSDNQISVSGTCNTAGKLYNYIRYSVVDAVSRRLVNLNIDSTSSARLYYLQDAICENGRFYLVIPIVADSAEGPSPSSNSYLLNLEFYVSNTAGTYDTKITASSSLVIN